MPADHAAISNAWPELPPLASWQDTLTTVHLWSQVVGKIRLEHAPQLNHCWGSALYVTTRGITTSPIPYRGQAFAIDFDFVDHTLVVSTSEGAKREFPLMPMSVASFYRNVLSAMRDLGIGINIFTRPVEMVEAIRFERDEQHASYDPVAIQQFWRALTQASRVFADFRARFIGKASPVHFFWGAFDLAVTRFSGRPAPKHPGGIPNCADWVMQEAYSHELSSAGFWAGPGLGEAAFYAYAYPAPLGFKDCRVQPAQAYFHDALGEFVLPYQAVCTADAPDEILLAFLQSTYEAAADLAAWDRKALEREMRTAE